MKETQKYLPKCILILLITLSFTPNLTYTSHATESRESEARIEPLSNQRTNQIVRLLRQGKEDCQGFPKGYRIDCIGNVYSSVARTLNGTDYRAVQKSLNSTSRSLKRLVRNNVDKTAPTKKLKRRKIRAVKAAVVASLNQQARKIISESATKLLRSASKSKLRRSHYTKIAKAFDSTKVILRS